MPFKTSYNSGLGAPGFNLTDVDVVARVPVGTVIKGYDDVQGEGEFIYLPGAAAIAQGDVVLYDLAPGAQFITRHSNATGSNSGRNVAFAVVPVLAGQFGWFQIGGVAIASAVAGTVAGVMMGSATTGSVSNTVDAGDQILGARISTAVGVPLANKSYATINRPYVQGQIT
jgi:hypothetical protein